MIKALIFDFDGMIIDTETPWYLAFSEIYNEYGASLPWEEWIRSIGTDEQAFDPYLYLEKCISKPVARDFLEQLSLAKHSRHMESRWLNPGVLECLESAKTQGLKIGLASSSSRDWVEGYLRTFNLFDRFDYICTREQVARVKPDPELYQNVLTHFGIAGQEAIAFEDSPNGAKAAKSAGVFCVIVPNGMTEGLQFESYDLRVNSLAEVDLEHLIAEWDQVEPRSIKRI